MAQTDEDRRKIADEHIARLSNYSRAMESEGDYKAAQEAADECASWNFWATHGLTPEQWDERQRQEDEQEKRYVVTDQNGGILAESDNWSHAARYFREWLSQDRESNAGAGIWDREDNCWQNWDKEDND